MRRKQTRGGIERKFITSILWVGVIPMTLALIIGYVFAREGQQIAVQQNLSTAAHKTADGIRLAIKVRLQMAARVADDDEIVEPLAKYKSGGQLQLTQVLQRLKSDSAATGDLGSEYSLYDKDGVLLLSTDRVSAELPHKEWAAAVKSTQFQGISYIESKSRYGATIVSPLKNPQSGEVLGFLKETQGVQDLLDFIMGNSADENASGHNIYEIISLSEPREFVVYLDMANGVTASPPTYGKVDERLAKRLHSQPEQDFEALTQWQYSARGKTMPVLMAYHRLFPGSNLYIVVYRPASDVFANINLAAILTLCVSSLVIGLFCVIAYRIVNNNIIRPVSLLNEGAQIIRQGDLELKLKIGTGDEIEELASSFNKMASALRHNINQLEESEEKYRSLIDSMRDGIFQANQEGVITFINPAGVDILGYSTNDEVIGVRLRDLFIEEKEFSAVAADLTKNKFVDRARVWMKRRGAKAICVELSANRVSINGSTFTGMEGTFRDVTHNVRLEQEARERSERISAINQIANAINSSLEAGRVYESIVSEVRKLISFDYAAVALLNNDEQVFETQQLWPEPVPGRSVYMRMDGDGSCAQWVAHERKCLIVNDLPASPFAGQFPESIQSCLCVPLYATGRILGTLNLGARASNKFRGHEVEVLEQMAPHVAVAIRNARLLENLQLSLEEVTRAREKLHEANEELKTLDEMKTNLLSNVSHELRTPLVSVMGYTDMILNGKAGEVNELQAEYLGISLRNIEKLVTMIENLLDFSRLHRGTEELMFDTFDIVDCARGSIQIVQPVADARDISLILEAPDSPVLVEGDKGKMGQVFNNLYSNAIKFNSNGGHVTTSIRVLDDAVEISVRDNGIGIPPEAQDKIFTRFYQYDGSSTRKYGGTGIGLAIAQDIMRLHGSRITVTSKEGEGAEFHFALLLSNANQPEENSPARQPPLPTETHLLVELVTQDRALTSQIRSLLLSEGMDVIHAAYPAMAISLANKYSPDCILVDTEAGPLGNFVVDEIIQDPSASAVPIVLLTNDEALFERYRHVVAGRVKRGFRKSTLLSGIHYALSQGLVDAPPLGTKVLCVDDDDEIVTYISRLLETEGYETDRCSRGEEALERVKSGEYSLVLMDVAMPGMDGWEACRLMKDDPNLQGIRVYMVTAKPIDKTLSAMHECGADGYLMKPFKAEDLLALVQGFEWHQAPRQS